MKNHDETINSVFERINEYKADKKRQKKDIIRTVAALCCFCLIAVTALGIWQSGVFKPNSPAVVGNDKSTDQTSNTGNESIPDTPDRTVIWDNVGEGPGDEGYIEWNGKDVYCSLYSVLTNEENSDSLIAISVTFVLDYQFVYKGRTLAEYSADAYNEGVLIEKLYELIKLGDSLKYGEVLYTTGTPDGEKWYKEYYDSEVEYFSQEILAKYIVNGEFLKELVESDIADLNQHQPCANAYNEARDAYCTSVINTAVEHLTERNISYERRNEYGLVFFATADEFASLSIDNALSYRLARPDGIVYDDEDTEE